jgi:hypothetical protein
MKSRFVKRDRRATLDMGLVLALLTLLCVASGLAGQEAVPEHFFDSDGVRARPWFSFTVSRSAPR